MLSLPPLAVNDEAGEYQLVLPCPAFEFIQLLAWQQPESSQLKLARQLIQNPALLLYAVLTLEGSESPMAGSAMAGSAMAVSQWFAAQVPDLLQQIRLQLCPPTFPFPADTASPTRYQFTGSKPYLKTLHRYQASLNREDVAEPQRRKLIRKFLTRSMQLPKRRANDLLTRLPLHLLTWESLKPLQPQETGDAKRSSSMCRWVDSDLDLQVLKGLLELAQSNTKLRTEFDALLHQEKLASLQQLAYGASHEINNPLANIASRAQSLLVTEPSHERRSKLAIIYEQALRSHEMISDLMLFANPPTLQLKSVELRGFLRRLIRRMEAKLNAHGPPDCGLNGRSEHLAESHRSSLPSATRTPVRLVVRVASNLESLNCDETHLSVALLALLQNSLESVLASHGSTIELRVSQRRNQITFEVTDDGRGVSNSSARHLFDPFYSGREAGRGLGFGLSKAWRIAQLHGGRLCHDPKHAPGAKFTLEIKAGD